MFSYEEDNQTIVSSMNGENYQNIEFSTNIDVGTSGIFSESLTVSLLDNMKASGDIDFDEWIELYPESIMPFKAQLKKMRQKRLEEQAMMQEQALLQQQMIGGSEASSIESSISQLQTTNSTMQPV